MERRTAEVSDVRVSSSSSSAGMVAAGFAIVYNSLSHDLGGFREMIAPGALTESLAAGHDVRALYSHDPARLLGRTSSGTLLLREAAQGLAFAITLPDTTLGKDLAVLLRRGDLNAMSFGFTVLDDSWQESQDGELHRIVRRLRLWEVSIVGNPAYGATSVAV